MQGLMMNTPLTITSLMSFAESYYPDTEIVSVTADNPRHKYTFKDAFCRIKQLANALKKLGAEEGDCIGTMAWNDYRHFELYYGISSLGMVCHTINPRLFPQQIEYIINHAEDKFLFIDAAFIPLIEAVQDKIGNVKGFIVMTSEACMPTCSLKNVYCYETLLDAESPEIEWPQLDENLACSLCYTSGTTGNPKGVLYSHRSTVLHAYANCLPGGMDTKAGDAIMPIVPMFHVNAWGIPYSALVTGTKLVFPGPKMIDGETLTDLINSENVAMSAGVPTIWLALLTYLKASGKTIEPLTRVISGGAACPLSIMEDFDKYDVYTHVGWGMTEMSPMGTFNAVIDREKVGEEAFKKLRIKAGKAVFGVELKIIDEEGQSLPWDGVAFGRLMVRGNWICSQYFKLELNDSHEDGWFDTGDVATIDNDGYMQITDRSKDVIKSGGEWISSIDLENTAVDHPAIAEAAVIGMPHPKWTERPLLLVVRNDNTVSKEDILSFFKGKVADWWIPSDCLFVDELAHTATGKLDKKALRKQNEGYQFPK